MSLPEPVTKLIESFGDLVPGVPANDENLKRILWLLDSDGMLHVRTDLCEIEISAECSAKGKCLSAGLTWTSQFEPPYFSTPDYPYSPEGMFKLLLELRDIHGLMRAGRCPECTQLMSDGLRLTRDGKCANCVIATFLG